MTSAASAKASQAPELLLTVLSGPEAGVAYKLVGQTISLGRSNENDVVLLDNKSSRNHARIERRGGDYWLVDLGSTAGSVVNGKPVKEVALKPGDEILVGATAMRFGAIQPPALVSAAPPIPPLMPASQVPLTRNTNLGAPDPHGAGWLPPTGQRPGLGGQDEKKIFGIIAVVGILMIAYMMSHSSSVSRKNIKIKDDSALEEEIEDMSSSNEKRQQEIMTKGKDTQQYAEAQAFYLRGFREYGDENYGRAIADFEAALALFPNHPLAKRYLERSRLKNDELVTQALERGEKDFQLERYTNAFNEYRTVLLLTNDSNNLNFQLAQKRIEAINLILMNSK